MAESSPPKHLHITAVAASFSTSASGIERS
jgi:hypothetical protein